MKVTGKSNKKSHLAAPVLGEVMRLTRFELVAFGFVDRYACLLYDQVLS